MQATCQGKAEKSDAKITIDERRLLSEHTDPRTPITQACSSPPKGVRDSRRKNRDFASKIQSVSAPG